MTTRKQQVQRQKIAIIGAMVAFFGVAGMYELISNPSGRHLLGSLLGLGAWPFVLFLTGLGLAMLFWPWLESRLGSYWFPEALLGLLLVYLGGLTISSLLLKAPDPFIAALDGRGGGLVGWALATASLQGLGLLIAWMVWLGIVAGGFYILYLYTPLRLLAIPGVSVTWVEPRVPEPLPEPGRVSTTKPAAAAQPDPVPAASRPAARAQPAAKRARPVPEKPSEPAAQPAKPPKPKKRMAAARAMLRKRRRGQPAPPPQPAPPASPPLTSAELPPLSLLQQVEEGDTAYEQARIMAKIIEDTLASFDIPAKVVQINVGPTVTQFGVQPGQYEKNGQIVRVRISKIVAVADDLALALAASPVRIEAPVPGKPYIGIEVPNPEPTLVTLRSVLESPEFQAIDSPLAIPIGRDVGGEAVAADLHKLPHLLIAGATGSGKSVAMNAIICGLLLTNGPDRLRMLMVDPKRVEFPGYNGIPHLIAPVVTEPEHASGALSWLLKEMDDRYKRFAEVGARNIDSYNQKVPAEARLPYIVMFVDELADMMMTAPETIEAKLVRLAQLARATGIHLIIATQRPSVDVVTGLIKANFPARLAFAVASQIDSKVILDEPGAEKLLGRGDGLFMAPDTPEKRRIQGCFVSDEEIRTIVGWWQARAPQAAHDPAAPRFPWTDLMIEEANADNLVFVATEALRGRETISVSALQRMLNIGYPRAARLMEELEAAGVVAPAEDGRGWVVLVED
ncbi:MAG TPA: DNA translocase FtsK [Anaerolineae bacterium]|nr:DNA translocase FtsK [Anaerolineae bacterium]